MINGWSGADGGVKRGRGSRPWGSGAVREKCKIINDKTLKCFLPSFRSKPVITIGYFEKIVFGAPPPLRSLAPSGFYAFQRATNHKAP